MAPEPAGLVTPKLSAARGRPERPKPVPAPGIGAVITSFCRGVAQLGSAPLWGSGGRRFKSCRSDPVTPVNPSHEAVSQLRSGFFLAGRRPARGPKAGPVGRTSSAFRPGHGLRRPSSRSPPTTAASGDRWLGMPPGSAVVIDGLALVQELLSDAQWADDLHGTGAFNFFGASPGQVWAGGKLTKDWCRFWGPRHGHGDPPPEPAGSPWSQGAAGP